MDIQYLLILQHFREATGGIFNSFFIFFSDMGWSIFPMLIVSGIYWSIDKKAGRYLLTAMRISDYIANFIKLTACVYRPWIRDPAVKPIESVFASSTGYSFPSGHTTVGTSLWGGIAVWYRKNRALRNAAIAVVILIAFSRNYVGVHTPQDVLAALCIALITLWVSGKVLSWLDRREDRYLWIMGISIALGIVLVLYANLKSYPLDYADGVLLVDPKKMALDGMSTAGKTFGFGIGLYLEHKYVHFRTEIAAEARLARFLCGAPFYAFLFYALNGVLAYALPQGAVRVIAEFIGHFYILFLYPLIFTAYEKRHAAADEKAGQPLEKTV